jgi:curved DNA-binding protein CbpA
MSNFYRLLGVAPHADDAQIKIAFRRLAKRFHPDLNAGDAGAEQRFKDINRAYATLRDPSARAAYDRERPHQRGAPTQAQFYHDDGSLFRPYGEFWFVGSCMDTSRGGEPYSQRGSTGGVEA